VFAGSWCPVKVLSWLWIAACVAVGLTNWTDSTYPPVVGKSLAPNFSATKQHTEEQACAVNDEKHGKGHLQVADDDGRRVHKKESQCRNSDRQYWPASRTLTQSGKVRTEDLCQTGACPPA
jgi:hypothetical protein